MGGSVRNRQQLLRIAVIIGVVLLVTYMFLSWRSDIKSCKEKTAATEAEYQDLLNKFNKLTDELKRNVQRAAETRHELEKAQKTHQTETTRKDDQVKRCMDELRTYKTKIQSLETQNERLQSEKDQLEQHRQTADTELDRITDELDQLRLTAERDQEVAQACKDELEGVKSQLLSAQTDNLGASQKTQECQAQLSAATEAFDSCEKRAQALEAENSNKNTEIQQLQVEINLLKQQKQQQVNEVPGRKGMKQPVSPEQGFRDINVMDSQKQKTLNSLKEKLRNGEILSKQEQQALQMLTQDTGADSHVPQKKRVSIPLAKDEGKRNEVENQQAPPPQPGNPPQLNHPDEEQVEDLVLENKKKDPLENLDVKEDEFEGGADGGNDGDDQHEGRDYVPHDEQDFDGRGVRGGDYGDHGDNGEDKDEAKPLPDPVGGKEVENVVEFPDKDPEDDDPHGHEAFRRDQQEFHNEWRDRVRKIPDKKKNSHRGLR